MEMKYRTDVVFLFVGVQSFFQVFRFNHSRGGTFCQKAQKEPQITFDRVTLQLFLYLYNIGFY